MSSPEVVQEGADLSKHTPGTGLPAIHQNALTPALPGMKPAPQNYQDEEQKIANDLKWDGNL